jgi:kynurenine formamidase
MRIRSFIIAYIFVLAFLLFADRRPTPRQPDHYSHVMDLTLTDAQSPNAQHLAVTESQTRIIAPGALIPGTWAAGQIPPERLIAPLVVLDLNSTSHAPSQISLDDIAAWESQHGMIPQGAIVAVRRTNPAIDLPVTEPAAIPFKPLPIARDAAQFLMEARYTIGFATETPVDLSSDRALARQLALHGNYVVEKSAPFTTLPATGTLIIVAPAKNKQPGEAPVRVLAMVR